MILSETHIKYAGPVNMCVLGENKKYIIPVDYEL